MDVALGLMKNVEELGWVNINAHAFVYKYVYAYSVATKTLVKAATYM